ncbi:hypothetical protein PVNG_06622 [Plasmodium vivax North Korean]|uniref:Uncharacterized protein n=1 Tax=Plasmodium vivax North Korean TaxID=1035514 RepID=A0A0J9TX41_PLAVI|nr:hypothetical protein PVNG_06622 [Plasmodium vivax North Korean]
MKVSSVKFVILLIIGLMNIIFLSSKMFMIFQKIIIPMNHTLLNLIHHVIRIMKTRSNHTSFYIKNYEMNAP